MALPRIPKGMFKSYFQLLIRRCWDLGVVIAPLDHTLLSAPPQGSRAGKEGILPPQRWKAERRATKPIPGAATLTCAFPASLSVPLHGDIQPQGGEHACVPLTCKRACFLSRPGESLAVFPSNMLTLKCSCSHMSVNVVTDCLGPLAKQSPQTCTAMPSLLWWLWWFE